MIYGWASTSSVYHVITEPKKGWHPHPGTEFNGERWVDEWSDVKPVDLRPCSCVPVEMPNYTPFRRWTREDYARLSA